MGYGCLSVIELCWSGFSGDGLYWCVSMGILGVCVFGSGWWCVWCVSGVLSLICCVFNFFVFFLLVVVRAFLRPRRCMICYGVPGPLYCGV